MLTCYATEYDLLATCSTQPQQRMKWLPPYTKEGAGATLIAGVDSSRSRKAAARSRRTARLASRSRFSLSRR